MQSRRFLPACAIVLSAAFATAVTYFAMDPLIDLAVTFFPKYQHYLTEKYWQGNSFLYILLPLGCFLFALPLLWQTMKERSSAILVNSVFYTLLIQLFITRHFILERLSVYVAIFVLLALPEAALVPCKHLPIKVRTGILIDMLPL